MDFIKKHYEKVLLAIVLFGLAVAAALLPLQVASVKQQIEERFPNPRALPFEAASLTNALAVLQRVNEPVRYRLAGGHNLFNPVEWRQGANGDFIKIQTGEEVGPRAVVIDDIRPLMLRIEFTDVVTYGDTTRYRFGITQEAAEDRRKRSRRTQTLEPGTRTDLFSFKEAVGSAENPRAFLLELNEGGKEIRVEPNNPYEEVAGYAADLRYPPENKVKRNVRRGDRWAFDGEVYEIVAITENEVVLSAQSSGRRWTVTVASER